LYLNEKFDLTSSEFNDLKQMLKNPDEDVQKLFSIIQEKINNSTKELKKSEKSLRTAIDHSPIMIAHLDHQFNFLNVNMAYAKADEKNPSFYDGKNHFELYPNIENEQIFKKVVETGEPYFIDAKPFEFVDSPERGVSYWDWSLIPIKNQIKEVEGLVLTVQDVTKRKKAEIEVEERIKELTCLYGISRLAEINDISIVQIISDTLDLIPPAWQYPEITCARITYEGHINSCNDYAKTKWRQHAEIKVNNEVVGTIEVSYLEEKPEEYEGPFLKEERHLINALAEILGRFFERKEAEQKLKESEEKYRLITDTSIDTIYQLDNNGKILFINPAGELMYGYQPNEMIDMNFKSLMSDDRLNEGYEIVEKVLSGQTVRGEILVKHNKGYEFPIQFSMVPLEKSGDVVGFAGISRDITERKKAEIEVEERIKELTCLYGISRLAEMNDISIERMISDTLDLIPPAWQYPEITCARITYDGHIISSKNYVKTKWEQKAEIKVSNKVVGTIEVQYLKEKPEEYEGPFLKEERHLINALAEILGRFFERKEAEQKLKESEERYRNLNSVLEQKVEERTKELKESESLLKASQHELKILNKISNAFITIEGNELYGEILSIILYALKSKYGVFGYIDDKGDFICSSMTRDIWDKCQIPEKSITYPRESWGGIWGNAMLEKKTKYSNKPFKVPEGHIQIINALNVPIIYQGKLIGNILVGNKKTDYIENDIMLLESISRNIAPNLYSILERMKTEQNLKESEEKFRELFNNMSSGVAVYETINDGENFIFKDFNLAGERIDKTNKEDLIGKEVTEVFPGVKEFGLFEVFQRVWKSGTPEHYPITLYQDDRTSGWRENYIYKLPTGELVAVYDDVTEQKLAQEKLKESEEKYRLIFDNSPIGIGISNKAGEIISMNNQMEELTQFTLAEINKLGLEATYVDPKERSKIVKLLEETGMAKDYELKLKRADGTPYIALLNINTIDLGGEMLLHTNMMDITERRNAEIKLKESEEKIKNLINNISDVLLEAEPSGILTYISPQIHHIIEYHSEELIGLNFMEFVHLDDMSLFKEKVSEALQTKKVVTIDCRLKHKKGYYVPISARWSVVEVNNEIKVFGLVSDNTERKNVDDMMKREVKQLKDIDQIKTDLINRISHELNTPLVSILSASEILLAYYKDDINERTLEYANIIQKGGRRLKDLVDNLLIAFRLESEEIKLNRREVNIASLIKEIIEKNVHFANSRNIIINIEMPKELYLKIDKKLIQSVLSNVISNAIKNTIPKGNVFVKTFNHHKYIDICVEDTGVGLTEKEMTILFKKFGKIERYGKGLDVDIEGPGLGLYISNEILKLHNSEIIVESKGRNKGSKFIIRLVKN